MTLWPDRATDALAAPRPVRAAALLLLLAACTAAPTSLPAEAEDEEVVDAAVGPASEDQGRLDPFAQGPDAVVTEAIEAPAAAGGLALRVTRPTGRTPRAIVQLQHGFQGRTLHLDGLAQHIAGYGILVVAPQMVAPGPAALLALPSVEEEAAAALRLTRWILDGGLHRQLGIGGPVPPLVVAGHSRGGGVAWMMSARERRIRGVVGIDPVSTSVRPALPRPLARTLVLAAGVEGPCAPIGRRHERFAVSRSAGDVHLLVCELGHADVLDGTAAKLAGFICGSGRRHADAKRTCGGLVVSFLEEILAPEVPCLLAAVPRAPLPTRIFTPTSAQRAGK